MFFVPFVFLMPLFFFREVFCSNFFFLIQKLFFLHEIRTCVSNILKVLCFHSALSSDKKQKSKIIPCPLKKNFKREINIEVFRIIERFSIITQ